MESLKHSLRLKLAVVLVGITAGTIIIGTIINSIFLGNYYMNTKQEALVDIYDTLNRTFYVDSRGNVVASATGVDILRNNSYSQGAQMLVINTTGMEVLANVPIDDITDDENMMNRIKEIIFNINTSKREVLEASPISRPSMQSANWVPLMVSRSIRKSTTCISFSLSSVRICSQCR